MEKVSLTSKLKSNEWVFIKFNVSRDSANVYIQFDFGNRTTTKDDPEHFEVYLSREKRPSKERNDFNFSLPMNNTLRTFEGTEVNSFQAFVSNPDLRNITGNVTGTYFIGFVYKAKEGQVPEMSYTFSVYTTTCCFWSETNQTWSTVGCQVCIPIMQLYVAVFEGLYIE